MQAEVKARLVPRLLELGFESTRTRQAKPTWGEEWKYFGYGRRRENLVELVGVTWEKYGEPLFRLDYEQCREDEMGKGRIPPSLQSGSVLPVLSGIERLFGRYRHWFGEWQSRDVALAQALNGLDELEGYLRSDVLAGQINPSQFGDGRPIPRTQAPLFWLGWLAVTLTIPFRLFFFLLTLPARSHRKRSTSAGERN
ncbi:MAG: hypothetical protein JWP86_2471 [Phenylobacterium sp.]|nr:hypothetical protein [Phenylobacterium sp.]